MLGSLIWFSNGTLVLGIFGSHLHWEVFLQVSIMFVTLEKIAQTDPKYADIFLLENYAAFQNR